MEFTENIYSNDNAKKDLKKLGLEKNFDYSKPVNLIKEIINMHKANNAIILDFFAGFRVIIMTQANSQVNTRVLELLPKFKIKKMNRWCAV